MSYNGSGTFVVNSSGQPVVTGTVISSTAFNALTADLATGLSTAITKDGQTTTTVRVPFAQGISSTLVTDATSATTGSIITAGGISTQKALWVGTTSRHVGATQFDAAITYGGVTLSNAVTGTGNMVLSAGPTITGTLTAATANFSGVVTHSSTTTLSGALTYGGVTLTNNVTGSGKMVLSAAPAFTGTVTGANLNLSSGGDYSYTYVANAGSSGGTYYFMQFGGGTNGSISNNGSVTVYSSTSDGSLKNWETFPQTSKRSQIENLWIGDFEWKATKTPGFGVIAQQAHPILGNAFGITPPGRQSEHWSAPSEPFGLLALWGVKDLYAENEALKARLTALENK